MKIIKFKKILEPFINYHTNTLTHIVGSRLSENKQINFQNNI